MHMNGLMKQDRYSDNKKIILLVIMKHSDEECFEQEDYTVEIVKHLINKNVKPQQNFQRKLIFKKAYCIYPNANLLVYPEHLEEISPTKQSNNTSSTLQLKPIADLQNGEQIKIQDFIRKMNCVFNRFNDSIQLKYDLAIFIKNIRSITGIDMVNKFDKKFQDTRAFSQNRKMFSFQSNFESGNLLYVFRPKNQSLGSHTYYLIIQNDINTHGYTQWFNFYVGPIWESILRKSITVRFSIINISKSFKFKKGMKIYTCIDGKWQIATPFIIYQNRFNRFFGGKNVSLDFQFTFEMGIHPSGVFFSLAFPYTYSKLTKFVKYLHSSSSQSLYYANIEEIVKTQGQNSIYMIKLSYQKNTLTDSKRKRKAIIILARQHPVESSSSFVCEHIIKQLLTDVGPHIEGSFDWFIFPMINPDGVIHGNTRTNLKGYDINRCWVPNSASSSLESDAVGKKIQQIFQMYQCEFVLDLHGHSKQSGFFCFFAEKNRASLCFSYLLHKKSSLYRIGNSKYGVSYTKKPTLRGQIYHRLEFSRVATVEISLFGYEDEQGNFRYFEQRHYAQIARTLISTLHSFREIDEQKYRCIQNCNKAASEKNKLKKIDEYLECDSDSNPEEEYLLEGERQLLASDMLNNKQMEKLKNEHENGKNEDKNIPFDSDDDDSEKQANLKKSILLRATRNYKKNAAPKKPIYTNSVVDISRNIHNVDKERKRYSVDSSKNLNTILASKNFQLSNTKYMDKKINGIKMHPHSLICYPTNSNIKLNLQQIPKNLLYSQKLRSQSLETIRETREKCQNVKGRTLSKTFREESERGARRKTSTNFWIKNSMKSHLKNRYRLLNPQGLD